MTKEEFISIVGNLPVNPKQTTFDLAVWAYNLAVDHAIALNHCGDVEVSELLNLKITE